MRCNSQWGPADVQPLVLSPKACTCMPRSAFASWPLMSHEMVVGASSDACSKVTVPLTLESPRRTATRRALAGESMWFSPTRGPREGAIRVRGSGCADWRAFQERQPRVRCGAQHGLRRTRGWLGEPFTASWGPLEDRMCSIERSCYPTFPQRGKPGLQRGTDVPALTILAV